MLPGRNLKIKCPACRKVHLQRSIASGNTIGTFYFSDGKRLAPMLPEFPHFVKCQYDKCGVFFTADNTALWAFTSGPFVRFLTIDEYVQAINIGLFNSGKKGGEKWNKDILSLRIELWRAFNHRVKKKDFDEMIEQMKNDGADEVKIMLETFEFNDYRKVGQYYGLNLRVSKITQDNMVVSVIEGMKDTDSDEKAVYDDNCREIISLMEKKSDAVSCLINAELHRNIGEYDMCKSLLKKIEQPEKYQRAISTINTACDVKTTLTVLLQNFA